MSESLENILIKIDDNLELYAKYLDELRSNINQINSVDKIYEKLNLEFKLEDFSEIESLINFTGYLTISILDLLVICKNIILAKYHWEKIHQLKQGYLVIYESIQSYHKHRLEDVAEKNTESKELYQYISKTLKAFKKDYNFPKAFTEIRNATIAHIDTNFAIYYDLVAKIDGDKSFNAILAFLQIIYKMQELSKYLSESLTLAQEETNFKIDNLVKDISQKIENKLQEIRNRR